MLHPAHRRALAGAAAILTIVGLGACGTEVDTAAPATDTTVEPADTSTTAVGPAVTGSTPTPGPPATDTRTVVAAFAGGAPVGGSRTEAVVLDEPVRIEVTGDTADEIHVHTYDLVEDVGPGAPAVFEFTADIPGVHEVELHSTGQVLFELQVEP